MFTIMPAILSSTDRIILSYLDIEKALKNHIDLFDFSDLVKHTSDIIFLLDSQYKHTILSRIDLNKLTPEVKVKILTRVDNKEVKDKITLSVNEITRLDKCYYCQLLCIDFKKYIHIPSYTALSNYDQVRIFLSNPELVASTVKVIPNISIDTLTTHSKQAKFRPIIQTYVMPCISKMKTSYMFWTNMINYNEENKKLFVKHMNNCATKTDIRSVFKHYPELIFDLTVDDFQNSKLTSKDWVLLIKALKSQDSKVNSWVPNNQIYEFLSQGVCIDVLMGVSTTSIHVKKALSMIEIADNSDPSL